MSKEPNRPSTVPAQASWNASENEWELGKKNEQGRHVGEWKWWLAPKGHLCCHTHFSDAGEVLNFKRFHPNGEISRYGTFKDGATVEDVYIRSSEPTTEVFAYNDTDTDDRVYKAVRRPSFPISYDYYDSDGIHLNPDPVMKTLITKEEMEVTEAEVTEIKKIIMEEGLSYLNKQFDIDFYKNSIVPTLKNDRDRDLVKMVANYAIRGGVDFIYHKGDLHLPNLHCLAKMNIRLLIIDGNLTVDGSIAAKDDPLECILVTGDVKTNNVVTSGFLTVNGNLTVENGLFGDYNDCSATIDGNLSAKLFNPEEYFFKVNGTIEVTYAFGNSWRLNENENSEVFNLNKTSLLTFASLLHENIQDAGSFKENIGKDDSLDEVENIFEFIDRFEFLQYVKKGKPIFKN